MTEEQIWQNLRQSVKQELTGGPGCHDFAHTVRVLKNAGILAEKENPGNLFAVRLGALLHDIARPEELASGGKLDHALLGAEKCRTFLRNAGCDDECLISFVSEIVRSHRYRGGILPESPEAKIVYDADKLDSLGAYGIARAFHFAGRLGAKIHNTEWDALHSESYSSEDSAYREYLVKLRYLPEKMLTESGRELAQEKAQFMKAFFDRLNEESVFE